MDNTAPTLKEEVYDYLNELRESGETGETGETNMFGAASYLIDEFGFEKQEAAKWLRQWMKDF